MAVTDGSRSRAEKLRAQSGDDWPQPPLCCQVAAFDGCARTATKQHPVGTKELITFFLVRNRPPAAGFRCPAEDFGTSIEDPKQTQRLLAPRQAHLVIMFHSIS